MAKPKVHLVIDNQAPAACHRAENTPAKPYRSDCRRLDTDSELIGPPDSKPNGCWSKDRWLSELRRGLRGTLRGTHRFLQRRIFYSDEYIALNANTKHVLSCIYDQLDWNTKKDQQRGLGLLKSTIVEVPTNRLRALGVSETTRNRALRELETAGFIERLPAKNKFAVTRVRVLKY